MADSKITALTSIGASTDPANDPLVLVDVSDTSMAATGTTKKVTLNQLLGASGTATLASATITGDLTVDTSTLKVDSANNTVGIGNATPPVGAYNTDIGLALGAVGTVRSVLLGMQNCFGRIRERDAVNNLAITTNIGATGTIDDNTRSSWKIRIGSGNDNYVLQRAGIGSSTFQDLLAIDSGGVCVWSDGAGGTRMTLNSTGLGVGGVPSNVLTVRAAQDTGLELNSAASNSSRLITAYDPANSRWYINSTFNGSGTTLPIAFLVGNTERMRIDTSGNVGIGVTPSAWNSSYRGLQLGSGGAISAHTSASLPWLVATSNSFINSAGDWKFINNGYSTRYLARGDDGSQSWWTSNNGLAGGTVAYTQAMTLDASGNLLVGKSVSLFSTVGVEASGTGFISATNSASTNATTNLSVYSTGAAAFRFYVGLGGTVYATNTTISAISDARLKENVQDIDVGLGAILALKPRKFDWKAGKGKDIKGDRGFIAQEFEQVFPQLVDEWKDAAPEGEAPYKSVRQDLIPVLVKAIQELTARVQTLETR